MVVIAADHGCTNEAYYGGFNDPSETVWYASNHELLY
jgi:hypothetical protein